MRKIKMTENSKLQWAAFQELNKTLPELFSADIDTKIQAVVGYFAVTGGAASEYNLIQLTKHVGININDVNEMDRLRKLISFYCGTGLIRIVDNNLGMAGELQNRSSIEFQNGRNTNVKQQREDIQKLKTELLERMNCGSEKNV